MNKKNIIQGLVITLLLLFQGSAYTAGPLRVSAQNPRYFADDSGRAVYLTGSHTWSNIKEVDAADPAVPFDYTGYLNFLKRYNHNFIRGWTWELSRYSYKSGPSKYSNPFPWARTGPGKALDGKPKFDLSRFDQRYFDRLRSRVIEAGQRGIYVSLMLFEGHGIQFSDIPWRWDGHPFNRNNNINGIDGDPDRDGKGTEINTLQIPAVTALQEQYVRKVIDTVHDLDNVLYEISNESGPFSTEWQYHMIAFIKNYEKTLPKQHPVGMTFQYKGGSNAALFKSPADWISPNPDGGYVDNPPAAKGGKVIISDTDHLWGIGGDHLWVWKSFLRGMNPIYMDPYGSPLHPPANEAVRLSMGYTRTFAERMNLVAMTPRSDLASTKYCLANPAAEYLVYQPLSGPFTVKLPAGRYTYEWFNPAAGRTGAKGSVISRGGDVLFAPPFSGDAVLYLAALPSF